MRSSFLAISVTIVIAGLLACGGGDTEVRDSARESLGGNAQEVSTPAATPGQTPDFPTATAAAGMVHHYICPKNCEGSGGSAAGTCPVCGSEYVHNQAYHQQQQTANPADGGTSTVTIPGSTTPGTMPTPTPEPAQNAAGVWHYTCAKGCAGGAGTAGTCATCGGALTHNTAYHQ